MTAAEFTTNYNIKSYRERDKVEWCRTVTLSFFFLVKIMNVNAHDFRFIEPISMKLEKGASR